MTEPYGEPGRSPLPPSKFGAGFTLGDGTEPPPAYGYPTHYPPPALEPPPPGATHYPPPGAGPVHYPVAPGSYPMMMMPGAYAPVASTNTMAVAAVVCSLVLAPLGIAFGHIALSQISRTGEEGRGLAIAGLIIGYILTAIAVLWILLVVVFVGAFSTSTNYYEDDSGYTYSMAANFGSGA